MSWLLTITRLTGKRNPPQNVSGRTYYKRYFRSGLALFLITAILCGLGYLYSVPMAKHATINRQETLDISHGGCQLSNPNIPEFQKSSLRTEREISTLAPMETDDDSGEEDEEETKGISNYITSPEKPHNIENLMEVDPPVFLPEYRNPCWVEKLDSMHPYAKSRYMFNKTGRILRTLANLEKRWEKRIKAGKPHRLRCLPYFYIIGMAKCGTTDLYKRLNLHPDITPGVNKEPHWWTRRRLGIGGVAAEPIPFHDYVDLFDQAAECIRARTGIREEDGKPYHPMVVGDASASTMWHNDWWRDLPENDLTKDEPTYVIPHYIRRFQPGARIIAMLRNPTNRLYSDYLYFNKLNKSADDFHNKVMFSLHYMRACFEQRSIRACAYDNHLNRHFLTVRLRLGMYHVFFRDWLDVFPAKQIHVIRLEDYAENPRTILQKTFKFLRLDKMSDDQLDELLARPRANKRKPKDELLGPMRPDTKKLLNEFYDPFNKALAKLFHNDNFLWEGS